MFQYHKKEKHVRQNTQTKHVHSICLYRIPAVVVLVAGYFALSAVIQLVSTLIWAKSHSE